MGNLGDRSLLEKSLSFGWLAIVRNANGRESVRFAVEEEPYAHEWVWFAREQRWMGGSLGTYDSWLVVDTAPTAEDVVRVLATDEARSALWQLLREHLQRFKSAETEQVAKRLERNVLRAKWHETCAPSRERARSTVVWLTLETGASVLFAAPGSPASEALTSAGLSEVSVTAWTSTRRGWVLQRPLTEPYVRAVLQTAGVQVVPAYAAWWCTECAVPSAEAKCPGCGKALRRPFPALGAA